MHNPGNHVICHAPAQSSPRGSDGDGHSHHHNKPAGWFKRSISMLVVASILNSLGLPLVHANITQRNQERAQQRWQQPDAAAHYANALDSLDAALNAPLNPQARNTTAYLPAADTLEQAAQTLNAEWQQLRDTWRAAGVSEEIIARQQEQEQTFRAKHTQLRALLQAARADGNNAQARQALKTFVDAEKPTRTHLPIDLQNMPWQVEQPKPQMPATTAAQLQARLTAPAPTVPSGETPNTKSAPTDNNNTPRTITHRQAIALEAEAQTQTSPPGAAQRKAQASGTAIVAAKDATAPTAADLAPTLDAPHTEEIKALAASLNNNPHKIYQWVHDNIHYFPSHGSVQGAQDTLDKKRGNAFDTASLLIALLRSAGIPARYVYGTIEIPVAKVQNWVGDAQTADAAQQILSQGGVPNVILTKGGQDWAFRMEHVWVETLIQYQPGRGARHIAGQSTPDAWIPMDGSYKQYTYAQGMDLQTAVPLDASALLDAAQQGAQVNEAEGWVKNLNSAAVQNQLRTYQGQLESYINAQNGGSSTVGDVLGSHKPRIDKLPYLAGSLPYTLKARTQQFSEIPANLRAQFRYQIYADQRAAIWGDSPLLGWQAPTAAIAGKKVTLAWVAATQADQQAIEALIPTPPPGQQLDPSQLPSVIPSSIRLKPEIRLDGATVASGSALSAGSEPIGAGGFTYSVYGGGGNNWDTTSDQLIAGQQTALGISIQGLSQKQLETLKTRMEQTKQKLEQAQAAPESQREAILQGITGEELTGDMLTATIWGYFASLQSYGAIAGKQAEVIDLPALEYGLFHAQVQPRRLYGIVTTGITFKGLNMDVGHLRSIRWVKNDNPSAPINNKPELTQNGKSAAQNRWIAYNKTEGQYSSAMEHATPEQFWVDKSQCRYMDGQGQVQNPAQQACAEGISAVKAIAIAQAEGQRIYNINQDNRATALASLPVGGTVGSEIRNAINAGKEVTFHESPINAHGWTGYGYTITDPDTGAGGYLIEGSGNGGFLDWWAEYNNAAAFLLFVASLIATVSGAGILAAVILGAISIFTAVMNIITIKLALIENGCNANGGGFFEGLEWIALGLSFLGVGGVVFGAFLSFLSGNAITSSAPACRSW